MKGYFLYLLMAFFCLNSMEAQLRTSLDKKPTKSEITLLSDPDTIIGALFLLKDSSILISNALIKEDYYNGNYEVAELYINDINMISSKRPLGPANYAVVGAIIGAGVGALTARITTGPPPYSSPIGIDFSGVTYAVYIPVGAVAGAITGVILGSIKIKIPINGSLDNYNRKKKKLDRYAIRNRLIYYDYKY
ncbi:MAG: hypothetical protein KAR16_10275 [Bacteroidales bacterium]|nr:hypothetical protein [Bacteroidales bacterium]